MAENLKIIKDMFSRPSMFMMGETYKEHVAFVEGMSFASEEKFLDGFQPFLVEKLGFGKSLGWCAVVLYLAFPEDEDPLGSLRHRELDDKVANDKLLELIEEFMEKR